MMWGVEGWGWAGMGLGMIVWVVLAVAVVWIVARVAGRADGGAPSGGWHGPDAAEELRLRFARGEISEEEYRSRLAVLRERPTGS